MQYQLDSPDNYQKLNFVTILVNLLFACLCFGVDLHGDFNASVQNNGGFLPDIILLTQCYYHRRTRLNVLKSFDIFSPLIGWMRSDFSLNCLLAMS